MQVSVGVLRHVVVEDNVDSLNVHTTAEKIRGNQYSLQENQLDSYSNKKEDRKPSGSP